MAISPPAARPPAAGPQAVPAVPGALPGPSRAARALPWALGLVAAYAAFADGAVGLTEEARLQVVLAFVAMAAAGAWLGVGRLTLRASPAGWAALALLTGLAVWSGISLAWSVAPDRTWIEVNSQVAYLLVLLLAVALGASHPRAIERAGSTYLVVAVLVGAYALGGKVAPWLEVPGLLDLDHAGDVSRLRAPLQYWNALALVMVLAVPLALARAVDRDRPARGRLAGLVTVHLLLVVIAMTYSRGALIALAVAVGFSLWLGGARQRSLLALGLAALAAVVPLALAFTLSDLKDSGLSASDRAGGGGLLALALVVSVAGLVFAGRRVLALEGRVAWGADRVRLANRALAGAVALVAVVGVAGMALSEDGIGGTVSDARDAFTEVRADEQSDPARLLSTNGGNRWVWWKEAAGAWSDRPARGWGAASFPVTHKRYRQERLDVLQPHSLPLQLLAEVGLVGALLGMGGLALLVVAGAKEAWRRSGREGAVAAALAGGGAAWLVHNLYDWDWDIPGATIPALILLGVLVGAAGRRTAAERGEAPPPGSAGPRSLALAGAGLLLVAVAISAALPAWSRDLSTDALASLGDRPTRADLDRAARRAELAGRLDPLGVESLFAAAAIAERAQRLDVARERLLDAVERQPQNPVAWYRLARVQFLRSGGPGVTDAVQRALALDPLRPEARELAAGSIGLALPPNESPTATGTPLPPPAGEVTAPPLGGTAP